MSPPPDLRPLFAPRALAVVGASARRSTFANRYIRQLRDFGFEGRIYVVHPSANTVEGEPVHRSLGALPEPIDYAHVAVPAEAAIDVVRSAAGRVRFIQVMSSGFAETRTGVELERKLVDAALESRARLLGPNCLGIYAPASRMTFVGGVSPEPGPVALISQSGGLATDVLTRGANRGMRFSGAVSIGNSADLAPHDFLRHFAADPETKVVGMYLEQAIDGKALFEAVRAGAGDPPLVILRGGSTATGQHAAASHTGALADDQRTWLGMARQTGVIVVETLPELLDALALLQHARPRVIAPTRSVVIFGQGGGASVLAADAAGRAGFGLVQLRSSMVAELAAIDLPAGTSLGNPLDLPAGTLAVEDGAVVGGILRRLIDVERPDAVVVHLNLSMLSSAVDDPALIIRNVLKGLTPPRACETATPHLLLVLRTDFSARTEAISRDIRDTVAPAGVPVFAEIEEAIAALGRLAALERWQAARLGVREAA